MTLDKTACPICGGPVSHVTRIAHFNMGLEPHRHLLKGSCEACRISLERVIAGEDTGWLSSSVDEQDLIAELSDQEIAQVEKILAQYPTLLGKWREFIAQKQASDAVCRFKSQHLEYMGLTIKRGSHLIGEFSVFRDL